MAKERVDQNPCYSTEQMTDLKNRIDQAVSATTTAINQSTTSADIEQQKNTGEININALADDVALEETQSEAETDLAIVKNEAEDAINNCDQLISSQRTELLAQVDSQYNSALQSIQNAQTVCEANDAYQAGQDAINKILTDNDVYDPISTPTQPSNPTLPDNSVQLSVFKVNSIDQLNSLALRSKDQIDENSSYTDKQKDHLKGQVDQALTKAIDSVNQSTTLDEANPNHSLGHRDISSYAAYIDHNSLRALNLQELDDAQTQAKAQIQACDLDAGLKQTLLAQIDQLHQDAVDQVNTAQSLETMNAATQTGLDKIQTVLTANNVCQPTDDTTDLDNDVTPVDPSKPANSQLGTLPTNNTVTTPGSAAGISAKSANNSQNNTNDPKSQGFLPQLNDGQADASLIVLGLIAVLAVLGTMVYKKQTH
ncbi:DUF1542 domain-containing protein [Bombilactobacillus folatiphilus]|uniref:DUF1542 domain-containing protein n=1 Tax=Bombilactobacillus folatiphilus TaxID=2923362 RepID=A0ABY4P9R9_9LACO|nr:DUF1542 domain-containing protein [Bombilactobacillus folatiphilus]UQS82418.1 DUF1542 domain-containing protein [Bombilactobacillus folatiphilus]